jgi:hypothetical protein
MVGALSALADRIPVVRIDRVWLFPPRQLGERESGLAVLSLYSDEPDLPGDRRQLYTLRYEASRGRSATRHDHLEQQGSAPRDRVSRVIAGVLRRLGEAEDPRLETVEGDPARWSAVLGVDGVVRLDRSLGE